eukprot:TRINITY_DN2861_c0_g2_i4.p1 TRINITY_DN2861_c0_g2~~TRINITY_DN2861_c0_g2_i4.p1  ORF type:complete len:164 (-),score=18.10 TRINITY_DN2861_c0_g2_i4:436-927(-)
MILHDTAAEDSVVQKWLAGVTGSPPSLPDTNFKHITDTVTGVDSNTCTCPACGSRSMMHMGASPKVREFVRLRSEIQRLEMENESLKAMLSVAQAQRDGTIQTFRCLLTCFLRRIQLCCCCCGGGGGGGETSAGHRSVEGAAVFSACNCNSHSAFTCCTCSGL